MATIQLINELVFWMAVICAVAGLALAGLVALRRRQGLQGEQDDDDGEDCGC